MDKHEKTNENESSHETENDWIRETYGTKVKNPNQNNQIHKQSLGRNARR